MQSSTTEKRLFTPGPLNTSSTVKEAMLADYGSRDPEFTRIVAEIRSELLRLAGVSVEDGYEAIPVQGSGTFSVESVIGSVVPRGGRMLVLVNGAYGRRIMRIAEVLGIDAVALVAPENEHHDPAEIRAAITPDITHVAAVHCETTSGILNPLKEQASIVQEMGRVFIVDAMSSFGGYEMNVAELPAHYLVTSSNKCIEGVPGFGIVIAHRETLLETRGSARSLSLDLLGQWEGLEGNGQFRFTPPTHALLAFREALRQLEQEGGVVARSARYRSNHEFLVNGMEQLGFRPYVPADLRSHIITTFHYPQDDFDFEGFYSALAEQGLVIYPGKLTEHDCFRIGNVGQLMLEDMRELLSAIEGLDVVGGAAGSTAGA